MNKNEALKFDIQMFNDTADNDSDEVEIQQSVDVEIAGDDEVTFVDGTPTNVIEKTEDKKVETKACSERLKKERERLAQEKETEKQAALDNIAVSRGFKNWKDLEEFEQKERLENMGIQDADGFNKYVNDAIKKNPIVMEAQRVLELQKQKEQEAILKDAIGEINKYDPDIKSIDDLIALPNYDEFYDKVKKGYSLSDAYKIVAFDKIGSKKAASAAQNVITNISSKEHLKPITGQKSKEIVVPDEIMAMYRKNLPKMSEEDIKRHYAKSINGGN